MNSVAKALTPGVDPRYAVRYCRISSRSVSVMQNCTRVKSSEPLSLCICSLHHTSRPGVIRPFAPKLSTAAFLEEAEEADLACAFVIAGGAADLFHAVAFCVAGIPAVTAGAEVTTAAGVILAAAPPQAVLPPVAATLAQPAPEPPPPLPDPPLMPSSLARRAASRASSSWISDMDFLRPTLEGWAATPPQAGAGGAAGAGSGTTFSRAADLLGAVDCCCFFLPFLVFSGRGSGTGLGRGGPAMSTPPPSGAPAAPRPSIIFSCDDCSLLSDVTFSRDASTSASLRALASILVAAAARAALSAVEDLWRASVAASASALTLASASALALASPSALASDSALAFASAAVCASRASSSSLGPVALNALPASEK
mmetsp:Transcript_5628/g.14057  ORF Transcript_5628/g.14057 Transcript_5628/m.14057 type:complete len:371 (+) Transcript_5628:309-1421(+)